MTVNFQELVEKWRSEADSLLSMAQESPRVGDECVERFATLKAIRQCADELETLVVKDNSAGC